MFAWFVRLFVDPRPKLMRLPLDWALWLLFGWTILSAVFSYAPDISIDKLRNATLFLIFYFILNVVRTRKAAYFLTSALIFSTMFVALWTPLERFVGRGVQISGVNAESPLRKAQIIDGDTILEANKRKIRLPEDLIVELEQNEIIPVKIYRQDFTMEAYVKRADLFGGETASEKLGIGNWKKNRTWRAQGFFSHFTTFAEVLQLIASLTFGLFVALISSRFSNSKQENKSQASSFKFQIFQPKTVLLAFCLAGMMLALLLSATRASQAAFILSAGVIVLINGNRRLICAAAAILLPLALIGAFFIQQSRRVGVVDAKDGSTQYRVMMHRDGLRLWTTTARNFVFGVGMDSVKRHWREWDLYDKGWQPLGHFHSTPLQLAVERGFPALVLWFWLLWLYAGTLWRSLKSKIRNPESTDWREKGILIGAFGGLIGFFASGWLHYNYGDAVIAMMFFIIMGLSLGLVINEETDGSELRI
jgi:hypothetical protein